VTRLIQRLALALANLLRWSILKWIESEKPKPKPPPDRDKDDNDPFFPNFRPNIDGP
jgi:hypothetical protein